MRSLLHNRRLLSIVVAVVPSLAGGLVGILLGVGGSLLFERIGSMPTVVVPASFRRPLARRRWWASASAISPPTRRRS